MGDPVVSINRVKVTFPDGIITPAKFVYHAGKAAVWVEDKKTRTARRILFAENVTFVKSTTAREPHVVHTDDGDWLVDHSRGGGCGCGSPMKAVSITKLLSADLTCIGNCA